MKNLGTILAAAFLAVVLVLYMCTFKVRFTEVAIKKRWGQPRATIVEPGLKFKLPSPIETVVLYDKRVRTLEDRTEETRTVDGKNVVLTTFTLWKIADPSIFHTNFPSGEEDGEKKLRTTVITHKHAVVGQHAFDAFVSTDPQQRKLHAIEEEVRERVARDVDEEMGIEIVGFGIKKLGLPQSVTSAIFDSMKSHEQAKAATYIAQGDATASDIQAKAKAMEARIMSAAQRKVAEIENEAQRVVSSYYEEFKENPELRIYLDKLNSNAEALRNRTTIILDTEKSPFDVFSEEGRSKVRPGAQDDAASKAAMLRD